MTLRRRAEEPENEEEKGAWVWLGKGVGSMGLEKNQEKGRVEGL